MKRVVNSSTHDASATQPGFVQFIEESGRCVSMPIERYRIDVFPNQLRAVWNSPDDLHASGASRRGCTRSVPTPCVS